MHRLSLPRVTLALSLLVGAALSGPVHAETAFTPAQRGEIEGVIKEYLLKNPQVLRSALDAMMKEEEAAQQAAQVAAMRESTKALADPATALVIGNPNGDVTMIEFSDYNCGFCKRALGDVRALIKNDPKLRVLVRDVPFIGGPISKEANTVALAVRKQLSGDKLFEFHAKLMESPGRVNGARAKAVAKDLGVDLARLDKDLAAPEIAAILADNEALAHKLGVNGTPSFIIGGEVIAGAVGAEALSQAIALARK